MLVGQQKLLAREGQVGLCTVPHLGDELREAPFAVDALALADVLARRGEELVVVALGNADHVFGPHGRLLEHTGHQL